MKLEDFLEKHSIPAATETSVDQAIQAEFSLTGALRSQNESSVFVEHSGTVYEVAKADIVDIVEAITPVVTRTGLGSPVRIGLRGDAELLVSTRIRIADFDVVRPFSLSQPSRVTDISFPSAVSPHEAEWFAARGLPLGDQGTMATTGTSSSSSCTLWSDTTSPSTSQPRLDNWVSDDSRSDGSHPDDSRPDDSQADA